MVGRFMAEYGEVEQVYPPIYGLMAQGSSNSANTRRGTAENLGGLEIFFGGSEKFFGGSENFFRGSEFWESHFRVASGLRF